MWGDALVWGDAMAWGDSMTTPASINVWVPRSKLVRDPVASQLAIKRLGTDTQKRRGLAAVPADLLQHGDDLFPLDLLQSLGGDRYDRRGLERSGQGR